MRWDSPYPTAFRKQDNDEALKTPRVQSCNDSYPLELSLLALKAATSSESYL